MRRSAGIYLDAVREGTRLAWWGANFTLEQMQRLLGSGREPAMDDATLKAKVETELFRPADAPKGRVTIGVADGVVELRGTAKTPKQIRDLERRAREIPEVRDVENLLHQPKTSAPTRTDAPAPRTKQTASSGPGRRVSASEGRRAPSTGKRAAPSAENRPAGSTERAAPSTPERPTLGAGDRPTPGTHERPTPSASERPAPSSQRPTPSRGERPIPSTTEQPTLGTPERPTPSSSERPTPGSQRPTPGTGERPSSSAGARHAPRLGGQPTLATGERATPSIGERATPSASVALGNVGAPGIAQSDTAHPRTNDVLGVLARQSDSGDHVNNAEICKQLG